jgi:LysM repeat protein
MKAHVFISVLAFHIVVIAGLYLLSACSSTSGPSPSSSQTGSTSTGGSIYDQYATPNRPVEDDGMVATEVDSIQFDRGIDPVFNSGSNSVSSTPVDAGGLRSQPRRPGDSPYISDQQPVLNEDLREDDVLQPLTPVDTTPAVEYVVQKGDSLWKISRDFGIALKDLLAANGLNEKSTIKVGQSITIPSETSGPPLAIQPVQSAPSTEIYTIVRGDTLSKIAKKFATTINAIKAANGLKSDTIQLGQRLTIPVGGSTPSGSVAYAPVSSAPQPSAPSASLMQSDDAVTHVVQSGETPSGIAKLYGITTSKLMSDNGIKDARSLKVGQSLKIQLGVAQPSTSPAPAPAPSRPVATPNAFDDFGDLDLDDIPEVEVVPRS